MIVPFEKIINVGVFSFQGLLEFVSWQGDITKAIHVVVTVGSHVIWNNEHDLI